MPARPRYCAEPTGMSVPAEPVCVRPNRMLPWSRSEESRAMADLRRAAEMRQWVRVDWLRAIADHSNDAAHCARRRVMGDPHCGFPHYPLKQREDAVRLLT